MAQASRTFRIFVSSTFSDLKEERNALQKKVFPKLRELCMQHGCRFQPIDLRWGVREEAALDQQTMRICQEEIARCQRITPRPHFIVLLGDRYGWHPLPFEIPANEFVEIEPRVSDTDKELLKKWYRRDDNAVPPVYCLQPRTGEFADYAKWEVVERRLHSILLHAAAEMKLSADSYVKYTTSATEQEIIQGLKAQDAGEHVFGFFRSIKEIPHNPGAKDFIDLDEMGNLERDANKYLNDLKDRLRILLPGNIYEYAAEWTGSGTTAEHVDWLCKDVYDSLSKIILKEIADLEESDPLDKEIADHIASGKERAKFFIGRTGILKTISEYVKGTDSHPLAVSGASGSGKSALMAHAAEKVRNEHKNAQAVVRFIGATPGSSDVRTLLESLCRQISRCYSADESTVPADYRDLIKDLPKRLALATTAKPLFLFLDALDQLSNADNARNLIWLPTELPAHVRLVISTLPGECLSTIEKKLPGANFAELEPMLPDEGAKLLDMWLDDAHRKLQEDQRAEILRKFELCGMPLYLRLAFGEAQRWKSYDGLPRGSKGHAGLSEDIPGIIRDMFWRLSQESNHGRMLVERSLGYLAASRNGLTEDEMLDVLSQDGELYQDFLKRTYHKPPEQRLPVVVWSRLYFDLEPYLTWRSADGTSLLVFFHRQLGEVVMEDYLKGEEKKERHRALAWYFGGQPYWTERDKTKTLNLRKTAELPYQQAWGILGNELVGTLTDFSFMEAKVHASGTYPLIEDYELAFIHGIKVSEERWKNTEKSLRLIQGALRLSAHVLAQDKSQLPCQLVGRLMTQKAPEIHALLEQIKKWKGAPWLRPLTSSLMPPGGPLLRTLMGHTSSVNAVALSPDGCRIISGSADDTLKVWDMESGAELQTLKGHTNSVFAIALIPNGRFIISGSLDHTLKVWDMENGTELRTLIGHTDAVTAVAVTLDGRRIISGSWDCTIKVWDMENGTELRTLTGHTDAVTAVAVTLDGHCIISGSKDCTIKVWDMENGTELRTLTGHTYHVETVAVMPDGNHIISGSYDNTLRVWDIENGAEIRTLMDDTNFVKEVVVMPNSHCVISGSGDNTIKVWDIESGAKLRTLTGHTDSVRAVAVTPDGRRIISGSWDHTIKVWDMESGTELRTLTSHTSSINAVAVSPDGCCAFTASDDNTIKVWDIRSGMELRTLTGHTGFVRAVAIMPDGRRIISGSHDKTLKVWDIESGMELRTLTGHAGFVGAVAITPDGRRIISGSHDKTLKVWDTESGMELRTLTGHAGFVEAVAITPDGRRIISAGSYDNTLRVWDIESGVELHTLTGHTAWVSAVGVTPDGHSIISCQWGNIIKVWDIESGVELCTLTGHTGWIHAMAMMPDGRYIISGSGDNTLKVWNLESGVEVRTLIDHTRFVEAVAVTPDGRRAISGSGDNTLKVWDMESEKVISNFNGESPLIACAVAPDGVTVVAGENSGRVHILCLENMVSGPSVITAWRTLQNAAFGCPLCRTWSEIPDSALGTEIPCPHCSKPIKLNPFIINADWRPVAKAWRGGKD